MENMKQQYLKSLKDMNEDDFTKKILKPLFESMGYERVDFNGGPFERGRDLIAQIRIPPRKELRVTYVQSKKIGDIQNTKESAKLTQLMHQLRQCCTEKVKTIDGKELLADDIYLACPEQISSRLLDEISGQLKGYSGQEIMFYDGPRILEDIKNYMPSLFDKLDNIDEDLITSGNKKLINNELLSALKSKRDISIESFYHDLSFFVGSIDSNLLLKLNPTILDSRVQVSDLEWHKIKTHTLNIQNKHNFKVFSNSIEEIERDYDVNLELHTSPSNKEKINELETLDSERLMEYEKLRLDLKSLRELLKDRLDNSSSFSLRVTSPFTNNVDEEVIIERISIIDSLLVALDSKGNNLDRTVGVINNELFHSKVCELLEAISSYKEMENRVFFLQEKIYPAPMYEMELNSSKIISVINNGTKSYRKSIIEINSKDKSTIGLHGFLSKTEQTLSLVSSFMDEDYPISSHIIFENKVDESDRVSISPHDIFSTGQDIAVYGGAGVGKTTTLQAYVIFLSNVENKVIIYVPLNRVIDKYRAEIKSEDDFSKGDLIQKLILISKNQDPTLENINRLNTLFVKPLALVLDGLDEIYNSIPSIVNDISIFKKRFPLVQLIISSRDCVSYLSDIEFLGITLLPFTRDQLNGFVRGWIEKKEIAENLVNSISKRNLYEHIKTPLLATIACTLVERGIDALSSEFEIYSERLRLLTGEYDEHKRISRQSQKGSMLRLCANKIAVSMHKSNVRSISESDLFSRLRNSLSSDYSNHLLKGCISELENPCNVIVKDPLTNKYSFGHFRFQEHLAANELSQNRNVDLTELTCIDWWRGALSIYAQINDISHLFEDIYNKYGNIQSAKISLKAMISNSPKNNQKGLQELLVQYDEGDKLDRHIAGIGDYNLY